MNDIPQDIVPRLARGLHNKYGFKVVLPADLRDFFLRNRIRRVGSVTEAQLKSLKREFQVDAVAITWLDLYKKGDNPQIGIGMRIVETETATDIWGDYTSFTGEDFCSWLDLGKITAIDRLMSKALKRLIDNFHPRFKKTPPQKTLFAIERFSLFPLTVRGKSGVNVSLRIVSLRESLEKVFVLLQGKKWPLKKKQGGWWEGEIESPPEEGQYFVRVKILTNTGQTYFLDTASYLTVDNTPPELRLSCENPVFSPNGDRRKDAFIVFPKLLNPERIVFWSFCVYNEKGEKVREVERAGDLPLGLAWHGETDEFSQAKEGVYYIECKCQDEAGNIGVVSKKKVILDKTPPTLAVETKLQKDKARFEIKYRDASPISQWELSIIDKEGNIYYNLRKEGEGIPPQIEVPLPKKKGLLFSIEAFDIAENKTEYKGPLISKKVVASERPKEKTKISTVWDYNF